MTTPKEPRHSAKGAAVAAILLAGGSGARMRGAVADKALQPLAGKPVIRHSIDAFIASGVVDALAIVHRHAQQREAIACDLPASPLKIFWAQGGAERQDSVWAALSSLPESTEIVLIHDAARPLVTKSAIQQSVRLARENGAACLARPVKDTIKQVSQNGGGYVPRSLDRSQLWAMETPQTFQFALIKNAYAKIINTGRSITDDLSAIEETGHPIAFVDNGRPNPKLTTPDDLAYLEFLFARESANQSDERLANP